MPRFPSRAVGLLLGYALDRRIGDPARLHPVAGFGAVATLVEGRMYADQRDAGVAFTATLVGGAGAIGVLADVALRNKPVKRTLVTTAVTWAVLGGRSLEREARAVHGLLESDDIGGARARVTHLVGRDASTLDADEIARATVESVAENTSDAVVAPLLAGAYGGIGGLMAYRAANTLDAMVGHRTPRYERFGWAAAKLDDLLNLPAARLTALLTAVNAPRVGGSISRSLRVLVRDGSRHPSPNAGPVEAAFAGVLDITVGGVNSYDGRLEDRHTLGDGAGAAPRDIPRAIRLADAVGACAAGVAALIAIRRWV